MIWTKETIQYFRSEKNQRALLIKEFPFFIRGRNNHVQLKDTKFYFRVDGWYFVKYIPKRYSDSMFLHYRKRSSLRIKFEEMKVSFEDVIDKSPEDIKTHLLFHLDLFR